MDINCKARPEKGRSLLTIPKDCTVIDTETTGYDPRWDEMIEIAALRVRAGKVVDSFSSLIRPAAQVDDFFTQLTGITNDALAAAPDIQEVLPQFLDFVGEDVVVGHNAHFDVNFIYDAAEGFLNRPFVNDIVDTMRLARHALPDLDSHSLSSVAAALEMPRRMAMQAVANIGGICADSITKKTNFLVLGNNDYCSTIKDGKSTKQKKAESLILKGQDLQILSESVFYDLIQMQND